MSFSQFKSTAAAVMTAFVITAAFGAEADSASVAEQFIQAYFHNDNMVEAVKLSRGAAEAKLAKELQEIQAVGAKEPVADKPVVTTELIETRPVSPDELLYVYRVDSSVQEIEPITAQLTLSKQDGSWHVSQFVQY